MTRLPSVARDRYRERFEPEAEEALTEALTRGGRRTLVEVARRYPYTNAGIRAWFAVGDLELEFGNADACLAAWRRGEEQLAVLGEPVPVGALQRREAVADLVLDLESSVGDATLRGGMRLPGPDTGIGPLPMENSDRWVLADLDMEPFNGTRRTEFYNLFPMLAGDKLLVTSSLRLHCIDAFSSELLWTTDEPAGWEDLAKWTRKSLFEGIDRNLCLIAPAAGSGVAVAALQVPYANSEDHDYQGIDILKPIPERRLHAFDLETGEPLWNHAPPIDWDGEFGSYEQVMLVAAPPVVTGSRVIVPCYRMRGRILFQVACYDLRSGERLWSTPLVSGQSELNMFGRQTHEFCGAPVTVDGDGVFVLSQLGTIARVDLFTGRIVWESRYEQIDILRTTVGQQASVTWSGAMPHRSSRRTLWSQLRTTPTSSSESTSTMAPSCGRTTTTGSRPRLAAWTTIPSTACCLAPRTTPSTSGERWSPHSRSPADSTSKARHTSDACARTPSKHDGPFLFRVASRASRDRRSATMMF